MDPATLGKDGTVENAKLVSGSFHKHPSNPLVVEDKPWEKNLGTSSLTVIYDESLLLYRMWYPCQPICPFGAVRIAAAQCAPTTMPLS
jgi:hypothetical protein